MPIYSYKCANCEHELEKRQPISEDSLTDCPNCKQKDLKRVIHAPLISFKGSGFYVNDSKPKNNDAKKPANIKQDIKTDKPSKQEK